MGKLKIALIGPNFFSYVQSVRDEIIRRGHDCRFYDERHSNSISAKIAYRLQLTSLIQKKRDEHIGNILNSILENGTTDVFLIATEVVDRNFVLALQKKDIRVTLYLWDSLENKSPAQHLFDLIPNKGTFDVVDSERLNLTYIPLFAEDVFSARKNQRTVGSRLPQLVFCGTLHSHRATLLTGLRDSVRRSQFSILELIFYHSKILYVLKSKLSPKALSFLPKLKTKSFTKSEIATAFFNSVAVLDIHHPGQTGLTSRTFEALRSGAFLITLNQYAKTLPKEFHERFMVLSDASELRDRASQIPVKLPPLSEEMDYFLSLARFVDELMALAKLSQSMPELVN